MNKLEIGALVECNTRPERLGMRTALYELVELNGYLISRFNGAFVDSGDLAIVISITYETKSIMIMTTKFKVGWLSEEKLLAVE